ncbi:MAG: sigma-70 family RNA polymerase sigma factor [bacterium]|nr:sigma-70 family RNA polymerase sigma factor [bacterium]
MADTGEVTRLLGAFRDGNREAFDRLVPLIYEDLRRIARSRLRGARPGDTLDTTSLVNEAWLRLVDQTGAEWKDRDHFLCVCARAMRQVVVSNARRRSAAKRGGSDAKATLDENRISGPSEPEPVLELDRALERLAERDEALARVVECRHFAGMTGDETARALGLSARTVERHWVRARAWLREDLGGDIRS